MPRPFRPLAAAVLVLALSLLSWAAARGARKPFSPAAPAYRVSGPADAPVVIVEFSDFECPACRAAEPPLRKIMALYEGKVRLVFKHFPLERNHRFARAGAVAAECAGLQGKFWDYHHLLYEGQQDWAKEGGESKLLSYAKQLKLDAAAWRACREAPAADAAVTADAKDGANAWVGATPTFFVNGKRFIGGGNLAGRGVYHIDKELKKR